MQFISNVKFLVLAFIAVLLATACSPEAASTPTDAAVATADGGGGDNATVGSDSSAADVDTEDSAVNPDVNPEVGTDTGGGTDSEQPDVAKLCPPTNRPTATIEWQFEDGPGCVEPGDEQQMFQQIKFAKFDPGEFGNPLANMMPAVPENLNGTGGCATIHDSDYCFPVVRAYSAKYIPKLAMLPSSENAGKAFITVQYPDSSSYPEGIHELVNLGCEDGVCTLSSTFKSGSYGKATYNIVKKVLTISWYPEKILAYTDEYKIE